MELRPLLPSTAHNPFSNKIGDLILSVATTSFDDALFRVAREATSCAHLTAFATEPGAGGKMIYAANTGELPYARETGQNYVAHFWEADPVNRICSQISEEDGAFLARPTIEELRGSPFRRQCHSAAGWAKSGAHMVDRVSVFRRRGERTVKISFHRDEAAGRFGDCEIDNIAAAADMLTALMTRQIASGHDLALGTHHSDLAFYRSRLAASAPSLTPREAAVCACIIHGMSSEGIALELNVTVNTVRTFRKRAYARLNICSQNELMKVVLGAGQVPSSDVQRRLS